MTRLRSELLSGIAAVSLLGSALNARADEHSRFRPEIDRHSAQDGRGETSDARSTRMSIEKPETAHFAPVRETTMFSHQSTRPEAPLRSEYKVRFGEDRDSVKLPGASESTPASDAARPAGVQQRATKLPIKSDVMMRVDMAHDGEEASSPMGATKNNGATKAARSAALSKLPVKTEVKMHMSEGGDDAL